MKVEVAVLGSPSRTVRTVSVSGRKATSEDEEEVTNKFKLEEGAGERCSECAIVLMWT